jgi:Type I restriction modification DNA specificity domain
MPRLGEIASIVTGVAPEPVGPDVARFIQIKDLDPSRRALVDGQRPTVNRAIPVRSGDVLVASRGERVSAVMADSDLFGAYVTPDVYLVRPDQDRLDSGYLAAFLNRPSTATQLKASKKGAMLPRVPKEALSELEIPLPRMHRQRVIGNLACAIAQHIACSTRLMKAETRLFESLFDRAFASHPTGVE